MTFGYMQAQLGWTHERFLAVTAPMVLVVVEVAGAGSRFGLGALVVVIDIIVVFVVRSVDDIPVEC
jgi:hypothetical protein